MDKIIIIIIGMFSIISFIIAYLQFTERGYLFNNAYIWASKAEREKMNKKPYYRQSAVVFSIIGVIFLLLTVEAIVQSNWLNYIVFAISILLIAYAIASFVAIEIKRK